MPDFITLDQDALHARLANRPVSARDYRAYLHAIGHAVPPALARAGGLSTPATYLSQVEALAYLEWLGARDGRAYRLPGMAELLALAGEAGTQGTSQELWPHSHAETPEMQGRAAALYYCEWTRETETITPYGASGGQPHVLGSVFYPPWLREGNNPKQVQAMMMASQGYSFVSFRAATDL